MPNRKSLLFTLAGTAASLCLLAGTATAQAKTPMLAGSWSFDADRTKAEEKRKISDAPAFSAEDRPRRSSTAASGGTGVPSSGPVELGPLRMYSQALPQVVIVQTDSTVTISDANGTPRTYRIDGSKSVEPLIGGESMEITARWRGAKLTTERKLGKSGMVREEYSIDQASQALIIEVRLSGPQIVPPIEMRRYYKAAGGTN